MNPKATYSKVEKADERAALIICNSKEKIMDLVRDKELATKVVKVKTFAKSETLPSTSSSLNAMKWLSLENTIVTIEWGWVNINGK